MVPPLPRAFYLPYLECYIGTGCIKLFKALAENTTIQKLDLSCKFPNLVKKTHLFLVNNLRVGIGKKFVHAMSKNSSLVQLKLSCVFFFNPCVD